MSNESVSAVNFHEQIVALEEEKGLRQAAVELTDAAYEYCEQLTQATAKNFYYSFILLPQIQQQSMYAIYAFARRCDDITDGDYFYGPDGEGSDADLERTPSLEERADGLKRFRATFRKAIEGDGVRDPIFIALADTIQRYRISTTYCEELIDGCETDLAKNRMETYDELYRYCYQVASTVGLICLNVWGCKPDPNALRYAEAWGLFMQLTNIMRDVKEDAERDRIYIPTDIRERFGVTDEELLENRPGEGFLPMMRFLEEKARAYREDGFALLKLLDRKARFCPAVMITYYTKILNKMSRKKFPVFKERIRLSKRTKLSLMTGIWMRHTLLAR